MLQTNVDERLSEIHETDQTMQTSADLCREFAESSEDLRYFRKDEITAVQFFNVAKKYSIQ